MPCEHELCLACFRQNVEEANFCCPMCRIRISTWARRAARNKTLVNEKRWKFIQEKFPEQVKNRLDGKEEEDEEMQGKHLMVPTQNHFDPKQRKKNNNALFSLV